MISNKKDKMAKHMLKNNKSNESGYYRDAFNRLLKNKAAIICFLVICFLVIVAIFAPLFATHDPYKNVLKETLQKPSMNHLLGTDENGRDLYSRIIYGTRVSLSVGLISQSVALVIGVLLGAIAGYYGGIIDAIISRTIEIFSAFPDLLFAIGMMFALGPGIVNLFIALGLLSWTSIARIVRGQILQLKEKEFVEASIASGNSNLNIIFSHLLPNCVSSIIVLTTIGIPSAILSEAALSFLGLGVQAPQASWGSTIHSAQQYIRILPVYSLAPGVAIIITVLAFNILGDALRDALDPRLKNM